MLANMFSNTLYFLPVPHASPFWCWSLAGKRWIAETQRWKLHPISWIPTLNGTYQNLQQWCVISEAVMGLASCRRDRDQNIYSDIKVCV